MKTPNTLRKMTVLALLAVLAAGAPRAVHAADPKAAAAAQRDAEARAQACLDEARAAMNSERYRDAARLYAELRELSQARDAVGDALYWEAFARYRLQQTGELKRALVLLKQQQHEFQAAATAAEGEALAARIAGELAARGEVDAAQEVYRMADAGRERDATRIAALHALMRMNPAKARPMLERIVRGETEASTELRQNAVFILCQEADDGVDAVIAALPTTDDPAVVQAMVMCLSQSEDDAALQALTDVLQRSDDPEVQQVALLAIGRRGDAKSAQMLATVVADPSRDPEVRAHALMGLAEADEPRAVRTAQQMVSDPATSDDLLEMAFMVLARSDSPEAAAALMTVAENPAADEDMRSMALFNAGTSGKVGVDRLRRIYDSTDSRELKMQVCHVLSQRGDDPEALDLMLAIVRAEKDPEIRENAVFWIGQFDDPRAADALVEIISGQ